MWHEPTARAVFWTPGAEHVPWYERAAPLRTVLHWSLAGPGTHLVHAAAVAHERAGVLLAGPAGSGKTTTALACLEAGMGYLGDDYVVITGGARPRAYSLYATAKAASETLALLPGLGTARCVIPRVTPGECVLRPVRSVDALRALAPSTILQHSHESAGGLAVMSELVRSVPAFELDLGDDIAPVPAVIAELLEERA
jgi:DNA polymerase III delta prime subunit